MICTSSRGNQHPANERTGDRLITNLCHSPEHKFYSRILWKYSSWVLLLDLFIFLLLRELMPWASCIACHLLETTRVVCISSVRKEYGRCSPHRKSQGATGTINRAVSRDSYVDIGTRATLSNTERIVMASNSTPEQRPQNLKWSQARI